MKKLPLQLFLFLLGFSAASCTEEDSPTAAMLTETDQAFVLNAADEGLFQISAGQVALTNEASEKHADFAQMMIDGYTLSNQELQTFAADQNIDIPTTLSDERQQRLDSLAGRKGMEFDTVYAAAMVKTHSETIRYIESEADRLTDTQLKNWAADKLPTLRKYLAAAEMLGDSVQ